MGKPCVKAVANTTINSNGEKNNNAIQEIRISNNRIIFLVIPNKLKTTEESSSIKYFDKRQWQMLLHT